MKRVADRRKATLQRAGSGATRESRTRDRREATLQRAGSDRKLLCGLDGLDAELGDVAGDIGRPEALGRVPLPRARRRFILRRVDFAGDRLGVVDEVDVLVADRTVVFVDVVEEGVAWVRERLAGAAGDGRRVVQQSRLESGLLADLP